MWYFYLKFILYITIKVNICRKRGFNLKTHFLGSTFLRDRQGPAETFKYIRKEEILSFPVDIFFPMTTRDFFR